MTRKHFEAIAAAIAQTRDNQNTDDNLLLEGSLDAIDEVASRLADTCADFNPNFDRARFLTACGLTDEDA